MLRSGCSYSDNSATVRQDPLCKSWAYVSMDGEQDSTEVAHLFVEVAKRGCEVLPKCRSCAGQCLGTCHRGRLVRRCHDNL